MEEKQNIHIKCREILSLGCRSMWKISFKFVFSFFNLYFLAQNSMHGGYLKYVSIVNITKIISLYKEEHRRKDPGLIAKHFEYSTSSTHSLC